MRTITVGTRQSALALTQTQHVIDELKALCKQHGLSYQFETKKIVTKGDQILNVTLSKVGGKGLFVKEIEQAMMNEEIDIAVHSMKDVPAVLPDGLMIGAVPKREDPRDCLITKNGKGLDELPEGAKVGTSSLRRMAQLKAYRADLNIEWIRGNIDSRIKKLETENFDAIVLAAAGLKRMGWEERIHDYLPIEISLPAVGQGALGIECRENDREVRELLELYNDQKTVLQVTAERSFLSALNGGCQVPIGAYAEIVEWNVGKQPKLKCTGLIGDPEKHEIWKEYMTGSDPLGLGKDVAQRLIEQGAERILEQYRG